MCGGGGASSGGGNSGGGDGGGGDSSGGSFGGLGHDVGATGPGVGGFGTGTGSMGGNDSSTGGSDSGGWGSGLGLDNGSYGSMDSPTGGFTSGSAAAPGLGLVGGSFYGGGSSDGYAKAASAFGLSDSGFEGSDPALASIVRAQGLTSMPSLTNVERNIGLGNYAEGQIVGANIKPTMRQKVQSALFGGNFTPSTQGLADAIAGGATQSDLMRGYKSGNLGSDDSGNVTPDVVGQISSFAAPMLSTLGLGPAGLVKMGLLAALGAPLSRIGPTPGVPGLGTAYSAYSNFGDLAAANRALGMRGGYGEAEGDVARASTLAQTGSAPASSGGGGSSAGLAQALEAMTPEKRAAVLSQLSYAPNAGWRGGVVNFPGVFG